MVIWRERFGAALRSMGRSEKRKEKWKEEEARR